jgi:iron complex transport system substrate-binding protein
MPTGTRSRWLGPAFCAPARRVVSLVPSLTEALHVLGAGDRVAGRTDFCVRPRGRVESAPTVGGTKNPRIDELLALAPDLVLANREENTRAKVEQLAARVPVLLTDPQSPHDVPALWRELGAVVGCEPEAARLADEVTSALAASARDLDGRAPRFVAWIWRDPWMAAGPETYLSALLTAAGWQNAVPVGADRYPRLAPSAALALGADAHLFLSEPYAFSLPADLAPFLAGSPGAGAEPTDGRSGAAAAALTAAEEAPVPAEVAAAGGASTAEENAAEPEASSGEPPGEGWTLPRGPLALAVDGERLAWYPALTAAGLLYAAVLRRHVAVDAAPVAGGPRRRLDPRLAAG